MDRKIGCCVGRCKCISGEEVSPGKGYETIIALALVIVNILVLTILYFAV